MKKGCLYSLGIFTAVVLILICLTIYSFSPEYEKVEIAQNIGGTLICNSVYTADHHDWQYNISYKYKSRNNKIYKIGNGYYIARDWPKDEQLKKFDKWIILKTGDFYDSDKVIVGNLVTQKWTDYKFNPETIEAEKIWKEAKIKSLTNFCCANSFITKIDNQIIEVLYKFRIDEQKTELMDERKLVYEIDNETGVPILKIIK